MKIRMMQLSQKARGALKLFVYLAIAVAVQGIAVSSVRAADETDYWTTVDLKADDLALFLLSEKCGESLPKFMGCGAAVNVLLGFNEPALAIVPRGMEEDAPVANDHLVTDGQDNSSYKSPLLLISTKEMTEKAKAEKLTAVQAMKKMKERRVRNQNAWANAYLDMKAKYFEFGRFVLTYQNSIQAPPKLSINALVGSAMNQYLQISQDPHTYFKTTAELEAEMSGNDNGFVGIGAILKKIDQEVQVMDLIEGGPAASSQLRTRDRIVEVDGKPIAELDLSKIVAMVRGPAQTPVKLKIKRKDAVMELTIIRGAVAFKNVKSKVLPYKTKNGMMKLYGSIKLRSFMDKNGCAQIESEIRSLMQSGVKGMILDLRENGGGLIEQARCIGALFLGPNKEVASAQMLGSKIIAQKYTTGNQTQLTEMPLVTLVNAGSASASELLSGALQDQKRTLVVGERSFGKGSVQVPRDYALPAGQSVKKFTTTYEYLLPSGRSPQVNGITPDVVATVVPNPTEEDLLAFREEDLYTNALPPLDKPYVSPRPELVKKVNDCVAANGQAASLWAAHQDDQFAADYQLYVAEDALACME